MLESDFPTKKEVKLTLLVQDIANARLHQNQECLPELSKQLRETGVRFYISDTQTGDTSYYYCEKCGKLVNLDDEQESLQIIDGQYVHSPCPKDPVLETTKFE